MNRLELNNLSEFVKRLVLPKTRRDIVLFLLDEDCKVYIGTPFMLLKDSNLFNKLYFSIKSFNIDESLKDRLRIHFNKLNYSFSKDCKKREVIEEFKHKFNDLKNYRYKISDLTRDLIRIGELKNGRLDIRLTHYVYLGNSEVKIIELNKTDMVKLELNECVNFEKCIKEIDTFKYTNEQLYDFFKNYISNYKTIIDYEL